jgi:hypothetical protein
MIAFSGMGSDADRDDAQEAARLNEDEAFVRGGADPATVTRAEVIVNPGNTVVQGTMIQAVTETALDSTLPGAIRAIVSEDVHSFDGTRVLIPRGARLIGRYRSDVALAQSRVMVAWDRIILPDNQTVEISAFGGDELGRTGTTGFVDTRFAQRFAGRAFFESDHVRDGEQHVGDGGTVGGVRGLRGAIGLSFRRLIPLGGGWFGDRAARAVRVAELLAMVGLPPDAQRRAIRLPHGQADRRRRRVIAPGAQTCDAPRVTLYFIGAPM